MENAGEETTQKDDHARSLHGSRIAVISEP
jgi:hypothetical protein